MIKFCKECNRTKECIQSNKCLGPKTKKSTAQSSAARKKAAKPTGEKGYN